MKRLLTCVVSLALCLSLVPTAFAAKTFSDVSPSHWAYEYVNTAVEKGWVTGMSETQYKPAGLVTGAQFLTMVVRAFYPGDIPAGVADPWYQPYVEAADQHDLRSRAGLATAKALTAPLNRYQMAVIMDNVLTDTGMTAPSFEPGLIIGDWATVPSEYRNPVARTYALGLLSGVDAHGTFAGSTGMNRAQAATVMCRLGALVPVQSPGTDPITPADMVSNGALLSIANQNIFKQYYFLYGLRPGAVFQQDWTVAFETPSDSGWPVPWFRVVEPGMNSFSDIERVWHTYFAKAWPLPDEYLVNYMEKNGKLYTSNPGIGDDPTFQTIQAEKVLSRSGNYAVVQVLAYHQNVWMENSKPYTVEYRYDMIWEDGQWKCCGLFMVD